MEAKVKAVGSEVHGVVQVDVLLYFALKKREVHGKEKRGGGGGVREKGETSLLFGFGTERQQWLQIR